MTSKFSLALPISTDASSTDILALSYLSQTSLEKPTNSDGLRIPKKPSTTSKPSSPLPLFSNISIQNSQSHCIPTHPVQQFQALLVNHMTVSSILLHSGLASANQLNATTIS